MAEIVEQVQEREAAHVRKTGTIKRAQFATLPVLCQELSFSLFRQEEKCIDLLAASQHQLLVLMGDPVQETVQSQGGGLAQKSQRRPADHAQLQLLVPQQHRSHLHILPRMKVSFTEKKSPPLTWKVNRGAQTGTIYLTSQMND